MTRSPLAPGQKLPTKPSRPRAPSSFRPVLPATVVSAGFPHDTENPSSAGAARRRAVVPSRRVVGGTHSDGGSSYAGENLASANGLQMGEPPVVSGEVPQIACPATTHGRELVRTVAAMNRAQDEVLAARRAGNASEKLAAQRREEIRCDRLYQLAEALTFDRATTLTGALHQVIVAAGDAESFIISDLTSEQAERVGKRLVRCLYSIRGALEDATGLDGEALGGDFYMRAELNPFLAMAEVGA